MGGIGYGGKMKIGLYTTIRITNDRNEELISDKVNVEIPFEGKWSMFHAVNLLGEFLKKHWDELKKHI